MVGASGFDQIGFVHPWKLVLLYENEDLKVNLRQLDEDNLELREKNLEVNHQLKQSQYEILELRRHLDRVGRKNSEDVTSVLASVEAIESGLQKDK